MAASNSASKWIGPEPEDGKGAPAPRGRVAANLTQAPLDFDRFHNHEELSPEGLAKAVAHLQETVKQLGERVAAVEAEATSADGAAKGLGLNLLQIGDVLSKRMSALEQSTAEALEEAAAREAAVAQLEDSASAAPMFQPAVVAPKSRTLLPSGLVPRLVLGLGGVVVAAVIAVAVFSPHAPAKPTPPAQVLYSPGTTDSPNN